MGLRWTSLATWRKAPHRGYWESIKSIQRGNRQAANPERHCLTFLISCFPFDFDVDLLQFDQNLGVFFWYLWFETRNQNSETVPYCISALVVQDFDREELLLNILGATLFASSCHRMSRFHITARLAVWVLSARPTDVPRPQQKKLLLLGLLQINLCSHCGYAFGVQSFIL